MKSAPEDDWRPIDTAPKDGAPVMLTAIEDDGELFEIHLMQWAHIQRNGLFPGAVGMWTAPHGGYTWNDDGMGGGPTHWRPAWRNPTAEELERARQRWGERLTSGAHA